MPQNSNQAAYMKSFLGKAALVDVDGFIDDLQWKPRVIPVLVDTTVTVSQSGAFFTTEAATEAEINFTLPSAASGPWIYWFFNAEDISMKITAGTADTMVVFNDVAADSISYETSSEKIGGAAMVFSAGGAVVYAVPLGVGGHVQTLTVAT